MNPLIRKEIRLLLPAWVAALVAATIPVWPWQDFQSAWFLVFGASITALGLSPFGQEMSYGTFSLLLVQPVERKRLWRIKTGLLAVAMLSAWGLFLLCTSLGLANPRYDELFKTTVLVTLLAFVGGLWTTLLLRDMVSAFFCTLIAPVVIAAATLAAVGHWIEPDGKTFSAILYCELIAYLAGGFLWARWLFLRAQDVAWTGGQFSMTSVRGMSLRWLAFEFKSSDNPWTALLKKELQLQEFTMFLVPGLILLHGLLLTAHLFLPKRIPSELCYSAVPFIWMVTVPFVIGCVAVAEERRFNTLEGLLCLPVSKRATFAMKLAVALLLGIVLGGILPWIPLAFSGMKPGDFPFRAALAVSASITGLAFYASTMSRGLLQAFSTMLCIPVLLGAVIFLFVKIIQELGVHYGFVVSSLFPTLAWLIMTLTVVWQAFKNYKRLQIAWPVWAENLACVSAAVGCVALGSLAIFDRSWEVFLPLEPHHGHPRIVSIRRTEMADSSLSLSIVLPDGRLWVGKKIWTGRNAQRSLRSISGGFAEGTNWWKLAADNAGAIALQLDGTLWRIASRSDFHQIGFDSDWNEIAAGGSTFMAVKQDGTLWGWGNDAFGLLTEGSLHNKRGVNVPQPVRVGTNSDWENVFFLDNSAALGVKRDGSAWKFGNLHFAANRWESHSVRQMIRDNMDGINLSVASARNRLIMFIRTDGSLWAVGDLPDKIFGEKVLSGEHSEPVRVGTKSDWVALSGKWQISALEANGTIWTMSSENAGYPSCQSVRPSKYTDWLAMAQYTDLTWALARDGTLSCWNEFGIKWPDQKAKFMQKFFLGPSRRPVLSLNILN